MMQPNILTVQEFATYRDVGRKPDADKIAECISLAENSDLYDVLDTFLFTVKANLENESYKDLLNGSTFTFNGVRYQHEGIKSLLADYVYSRFVYVVNTNFTPFGAVKKHNDNSTPVERNMLKDIKSQTLKDADIKFTLIDKYLRSNKELFADYNKGNNSDISQGQRFYTL